uniref:Uncharacterized protein n=1 Tax=Anguilla anguilla TaxID=7936 RepID=A0A0E9WXI6_ANGAN
MFYGGVTIFLVSRLDLGSNKWCNTSLREFRILHSSHHASFSFTKYACQVHPSRKKSSKNEQSADNNTNGSLTLLKVRQINPDAIIQRNCIFV